MDKPRKSGESPATVRCADASLVEAIALRDRGALVSIVGGGGKSALLFALGARLPARVLLTTTTRIFAAQIARAVASNQIGADLAGVDLAERLDTGPSGSLWIGHVEGEKAFGVDPGQPKDWLARPSVRHVIVEADGSRMRPIKAPAEHEPAIAAGTTDVVVVFGIDALDAPLSASAHRPERVFALLNRDLSSRGDGPLDEAEVATLVTHDQGGMKNVPSSARVLVLINKVETEGQRAQAECIAGKILAAPRVERVVVGALEGPHPDAWHVYRRRSRDVHARGDERGGARRNAAGEG